MKKLVYPVAMAAMVCMAEKALAQEAEGVTINGITWATANVGVEGKFIDNPWDFGLRYNFEEAQKACPEGWRTPTVKEFEVLVQAPNEWMTVNEIGGRRFGSGDNTIFLPAAGYRGAAGSVGFQGSYGYYWSSTAYSGWTDYNLNFSGANVYPSDDNYYAYGFSVRCVKE